MVDLRARLLRLPQLRATEVNTDRYAVVELHVDADTAPGAQAALGDCVRSFATRELAELYAADEIKHGHPVKILDRSDRHRITRNRRLLGLPDSLPPDMQIRKSKHGKGHAR